MANTFTGLKLQGQIGKFGAKELSDIEGLCLLYQFFYRVEFFFLEREREVGREWRHKGLKCEKCLRKIKTQDQELCIAQEPTCTFYEYFYYYFVILGGYILNPLAQVLIFLLAQSWVVKSELMGMVGHTPVRCTELQS